MDRDLRFAVGRTEGSGKAIALDREHGRVERCHEETAGGGAPRERQQVGRPIGAVAAPRGNCDESGGCDQRQAGDVGRRAGFLPKQLRVACQ